VTLPRVPKPRPNRRTAAIRLLRDGQHVDEVIDLGIRAVKTSVWIATANLKDVHVKALVGTTARARGRFISLFDELEQVAKRGVDVRILHAGPPSRMLTQRLKPANKTSILLRRCPRVHLKMIAVDGATLYLGSANFTGAGLGAKGEHKRNFEAGIVTDDEWLLDEMQGTFDAIWTGKHCGSCQLRSECPRPLDEYSKARGHQKR
jgi:phosphatidylserine/phosphatidylglycerophosphate/cardiolipin synthase-like enzyme